MAPQCRQQMLSDKDSDWRATFVLVHIGSLAADDMREFFSRANDVAGAQRRFDELDGVE